MKTFIRQRASFSVRKLTHWSVGIVVWTIRRSAPFPLFFFFCFFFFFFFFFSKHTPHMPHTAHTSRTRHPPPTPYSTDPTTSRAHAPPLWPLLFYCVGGVRVCLCALFLLFSLPSPTVLCARSLVSDSDGLTLPVWLSRSGSHGLARGCSLGLLVFSFNACNAAVCPLDSAVFGHALDIAHRLKNAITQRCRKHDRFRANTKRNKIGTPFHRIHVFLDSIQKNEKNPKILCNRNKAKHFFNQRRRTPTNGETRIQKHARVHVQCWPTRWKKGPVLFFVCSNKRKKVTPPPHPPHPLQRRTKRHFAKATSLCD